MKAMLTGSVVVLTALMMSGCKMSGESQGTIAFYVGSSDGTLEHSVYLCGLDPVKGEFAILDSFAGARGPSYLAFSPGKDYLYAINSEISDTAMKYRKVTSFRVQGEGNRLEPVNSQSSQGDGPCHVHCSKKGTYLFAANYGSGNLAAFPLSESGEILPASSVVQSSGTGPVEGRQEGPHTHYVSLDPEEHYLLSPDLGTDRVLIFGFDHAGGTLSPNPVQPFFNLAPGAGPRHLVFHPSGQFVFVVNELNATVTACRWDGSQGSLTEINTVATVEDAGGGGSYPAAIRVHPEGRFLYASTRGAESSIAVYEVNGDGSIQRIQVVEGVPAWPRDFNIDPSGKYLITAGERSGEIALYNIDQRTGKLSETGIKASVPSPGCVLFID